MSYIVVGSRLALKLQIICVSASVGPSETLTYFFLNLTLSAKYSYGWVILNRVESISVNMCLILIKRIKDEINFSIIFMLILYENFCRVV